MGSLCFSVVYIYIVNGDLNWKHISLAMKHELYDEISSSFMVIINKNKNKYSKITDPNIKIILNKLKKNTSITENEVNYIASLIERALSFKKSSFEIRKGLLFFVLIFMRFCVFCV